MKGGSVSQYVIAATIPGLLGTIERALNDTHQMVTLTRADDVARLLDDATRAVHTLVLDDTIVSYADTPIDHALWDIIETARRRAPMVRVLLLLTEGILPPHVTAQLGEAARATGGDVSVVARQHEERAMREAVLWVTAQLAITARHRQDWLMALSGSGGVGKSTQLANLSMTLQRRGYRVLAVDADFAGGSLIGFFKVAAGSIQPFLTLREAYPELAPVYPIEAVDRLVYKDHPSGVHLLFSGRGMIEVRDMNGRSMQALIRAIRQLPYDIVCLDAGPDVKARPHALDVLSDGGLGIVICPPGSKELNGARSILELIRHLRVRQGNSSLLTQTGVLYMEPEMGHIARISEVARQMRGDYPDAADFGIVPRDAPTVSRIAQHETFASVFDIAPRSPYARALDLATDRILLQLNRPQTLNPPRPRTWRNLLPGRGAAVAPKGRV